MRDGDDAFVRRVSEELRAPVRVGAGFDGRVMADVRASSDARGAWRGRLRWLLRPRTVRISPLVGVALVASVAGVAVLIGSPSTMVPGADVPVIATTGPAGNVRLSTRATLDARRSTRFTLPAPAATSVALVGDFNDWDASATPLERGADGRWTAFVALLPGRYEYAFVVDAARVVADPTAPQALASDFGAPNSVITVGRDTP